MIEQPIGIVTHAGLNLLHSQNEDGMIKMRKPGFADGYQIALLANGLDVPGARAVDKGGEPEILALPDLAYGQSVHGGVGEMRQQARRRNDGLVEITRRGEAA